MVQKAECRSAPLADGSFQLSVEDLQPAPLINHAPAIDDVEPHHLREPHEHVVLFDSSGSTDPTPSDSGLAVRQPVNEPPDDGCHPRGL